MTEKRYFNRPALIGTVFIAALMTLTALAWYGSFFYSGRQTPSTVLRTAVKVVMPPQVSPTSTLPGSIFHTQGLRDKFVKLTQEDLPSYQDPRGRIPIASWNGSVYAAAQQHVVKYGLDGQFLGMTYLDDMDCANDLAVMGDSLFVACWGKGLYEIDLKTEKIAYRYDASNGLLNLSNLQLVPTDDYLWIGTFGGAARLDPATHEMKFYRTELGVPGEIFTTRIVAENGQVWALVTANAYTPGGAALYDDQLQTWKAYLSKDFKTKDLTRIDFNGFVVTDSAAYATYQDGGPDNTVISRLDFGQPKWQVVAQGADDAISAQFKDLTGYAGFSQERSNTQFVDGKWKVRVMVKGKTVSMPMDAETYFAMLKYGDEAYYFIALAGFQALKPEDALPRTIPSDFSFADINRLIRSPNGRYVVATSIVRSDYDGTLGEIKVMVYDPDQPDQPPLTAKFQPPSDLEAKLGEVTLEQVTDTSMHLWQPEIGSVFIDLRAHRMEYLPRG